MHHIVVHISFLRVDRRTWLLKVVNKPASDKQENDTFHAISLNILQHAALASKKALVLSTWLIRLPSFVALVRPYAHPSWAQDNPYTFGNVAKLMQRS